jgi:Cysteine-rich secretory protein family
VQRALAVFIVAWSASFLACGDDPNVLKDGRRPQRSGGVSSSADESGDDDGSEPGGGGTTSSPSSPASPSAPSSPGGGGNTTPPAGGLTPEDVCVAEINRYRQTLGRPPLARWSEAEACSDEESMSDGNTGRAHGAFPKCGEYAQNECPGWAGAPAQMIKGCLKAMWGEGPGGGHYENMASQQWKKVACGFHTLPSGAVWSVQNFR